MDGASRSPRNVFTFGYSSRNLSLKLSYPDRPRLAEMNVLDLHGALSQRPDHGRSDRSEGRCLTSATVYAAKAHPATRLPDVLPGPKALIDETREALACTRRSRPCTSDADSTRPGRTRSAMHRLNSGRSPVVAQVARMRPSVAFASSELSLRSRLAWKPPRLRLVLIAKASRPQGSGRREYCRTPSHSSALHPRLRVWTRNRVRDPSQETGAPLRMATANRLAFSSARCHGVHR